MSAEEQMDEMSGTKPLAEHEWLNKLVGDWTIESEMWMEPGGEPMKGTGKESVINMGGLWAYGQGKTVHPGGEMDYVTALGYDVSFKEYRGCWFAGMSSHLWKYVGTLSEDGRTMTLNCEGPDMERDGETANYRDVIEIQDENHRTLTSYGQDKNTGEWGRFMHSKYTRV